MSTDLTELIERVRNATGPDINLSREILCACGWSFEKRNRDAKSWMYGPDGERKDTPGHRGAPHITSSLDAITALIEKRLPLAFITVERFSVSDEAGAEWRAWVKVLNEDDLSSDSPSVRQNVGFGKSPRPALALTLAFLLAIQENSRDQ